MSSQNHQQNDGHIDENLYSRSLYVLGHEALKKMAQSNVLISGLGGLGVEIAKNVILSGVKSVTIHDTQTVQWTDFSSQFFLTPNHLGQNRAESSLHKLQELNQYVPVHVSTGELTESILSKFDVAVFADYCIPQLTELNQVCRKNGVKFIAADSKGVFGVVFCDFGNHFEVIDPDGEQVVTNIVTNITNDENGAVTIHDDKATHGLYDGDLVSFEDVGGMAEVNGKVFEIKSTGKHTFTIGDTRGFGKYTSGGFAKQVKKKTYIDFLPLKDALEDPKYIETDFSKFGRPLELHAALRALGEFSNTFGRLPNSYDEGEASRVVELAKKYFKGEGNLNENLIKSISYTVRGNLSPMAAFIGGIASQEVQKAVSGKFGPLNQFLYIDSVESLPEKLPTDFQPLNCRYDGQIAVFGKAYQEKLLNTKVFIVGAGALGCEYLKSYAIMGVGCGPQGKILVTDMDSIEVSNLNRQFLFRRQHVGKMKSIVAAEAAKEMNNDLNIIAMCDKVGPDTEEQFNDDFWESIDCITNALDNVQARLYVDSRCIYYKKPLLEAGTLGTKGNVQVVIPFLTESYGSTPDPPEKEIPICTLKNFPNIIDHCIQWGRDLFEGMFKKVPEEINAYLSRPDFMKELDKQPNAKKATLENIYDGLIGSKPLSFEDCIVWARLKFEELFNQNIQQLLYNFPVDMVTSTGAPFWGGPKRPPTPLKFSPKDKTHMEFVIAGANLRAEVYGLKGHREDFDYLSVLSRINIPEWKPKTGVKIAANDTEEKNGSNNTNAMEDEDTIIEDLLSKIPSPSSLIGYRLNPVEFEKDDDANYHIDFIAAASNMRARNYKIKEENRHNTKGIAGKIIPAMITTTALITGLALLEFFKVMDGKNKLTDYRNAYVNIGLPFVTLSEPAAPVQQKMKDKPFTFWDRIEVNVGKDMTMKEFMDYFKQVYNFNISMMSAGTAVIYSCFGDKKKIQQRMNMPLSEVVREVSKLEFKAKQKYITLEVMCTDQDDEDVDTPPVRYRFKF